MDFVIIGYIINCICLFFLYSFTIIYLLITFKPIDYLEISKLKNKGFNKNYMIFYNLVPFFTLYYIFVFIYFYLKDENIGFRKIYNSCENSDEYCNIFNIREV